MRVLQRQQMSKVKDIVTREPTDEERRRHAFFHWTTQLRLAYNRDPQAIERAELPLKRFHDLLGDSGIPRGRDAVLKLERIAERDLAEFRSEAMISLPSYEIRAHGGMAKIHVSSAFIKATVKGPQCSDMYTRQRIELLVNAKFGGRGVLRDPCSFRPEEKLRDLSDFVERLYEVTASYDPAAGLGIGMMAYGSPGGGEHGGKGVYYDHFPLYFKCATEKNATFWFVEKKREGIVRLERDGRVYYRSAAREVWRSLDRAQRGGVLRNTAREAWRNKD